MSWAAFQVGSTIGTQGSERGVIIDDQEHTRGARVTLERTDDRPYTHAITCGVGGTFLHTCFFGDLSAAQDALQRFKPAIEGVLDLLPAGSCDLEDFGPAIDAFQRIIDEF